MLFFNLSAFYFFYFAATGIYVIFLPKILNDFGYSAFDIGIVLAVAPLMRFLAPFLFLKHIKLNDNLLKFSLFLAIVSVSLFYISLENFWLFLINNALLAVALSIILPFIELIAISNLKKDRYGKSRLYGSLGFMFIAIILANSLNSSYTAIHFYLFVVVLSSLFALILRKYELNINDEKESNSSFSFLKYLPFWIALFLMQVSFGGFYNFFTIYEMANGISLEMTSYLWAFGVVCEIIMLYFQAPLLKRNLLNIIKFCVAITSFRWLLLWLFPESLEIAFISQSIHAFSFGLFHSAVIIYLLSLYDNKKLAQQFMYGVAYGLGGFVGSLIAGKVYGENLFLYSAIFAFIAFISLNFLTKK